MDKGLQAGGFEDWDVDLALTEGLTYTFGLSFLFPAQKCFWLHAPPRPAGLQFLGCGP